VQVYHLNALLSNYGWLCAGREQERQALQAGFAEARHYEIGFGMMGVLVATRGL